ncbi:transposase domain-containing protein [Acidithrix ferrooxidans]|uniref:Transposase IS4 N-terminal domain-containing protein n=1 Tax=Acidithrix ferrooxidans TaxID=1280514 RepID=A0A0D8HH75_9ACTN|nr:hypothetical protein AXFE_19220 [Acidithrix ferrooxidans]
MPRPGWRRQPDNALLADHISIGVLTRTFIKDLIDDILNETDKLEQRVRLMPARMVTC